MAATKQPSILFLLLTLVTLISSIIINSSNATECGGTGAISVYWGQGSNNVTEGTLEEACASGNYNIVILNGLIIYDNGDTPTLNLGQHCGSSNNPCTRLQSQIEYCQNEKNIKVFLSIDKDTSTAPPPPPPPSSPSPSPSPSSEDEDEAKKLAEYLLENYLSGQPGPLGNVSLDGIDIEDVADSAHLKWDALVTAINASTTARKIYISASPQCVYPDYYLDKAIKTGLVDYIWVEFYYQNPCIYSNGNATNLLSAWEKWTSSVPNSLIFLGVAASEEAVTAGYITPDELISDVLPTVQTASNYGGVMVWDRYYDNVNNYTAQIKGSVSKVCRCVCDEPARASFPRLVESI